MSILQTDALFPEKDDDEEIAYSSIIEPTYEV